MTKFGENNLVEELQDLFQSILDQQVTFDEWRTTKTIPILKKGKTDMRQRPW